jgi:Flp pilus assembly protein TadG
MLRAKTRMLGAGGSLLGRKRRAGMGIERMAHMLRRPTRPFRTLARQISRFISAQDGGTEFVEFEIVFPVFIAMIVAMLEICYFLFAQQTLQTAAVEMGRQFMTNQAPSQGSTVNASGQLKSGSSVCNIIQPLLSCGSVIVNVQSYQDYGSANTGMPSLYYNNCNANTSWTYTAGPPGQIVVIQLMYPLKIVTGPLGFALSNSCNGDMVVMGVTAIRVEPS